MCIHVHNPFPFSELDSFKKKTTKEKTNPTSGKTGRVTISTREKTYGPLDCGEQRVIHRFSFFEQIKIGNRPEKGFKAEGFKIGNRNLSLLLYYESYSYYLVLFFFFCRKILVS